MAHAAMEKDIADILKKKTKPPPRPPPPYAEKNDSDRKRPLISTNSVPGPQRPLASPRRNLKSAADSPPRRTSHQEDAAIRSSSLSDDTRQRSKSNSCLVLKEDLEKQILSLNRPAVTKTPPLRAPKPLLQSKPTSIGSSSSTVGTVATGVATTTTPLMVRHISAPSRTPPPTQRNNKLQVSSTNYNSSAPSTPTPERTLTVNRTPMGNAAETPTVVRSFSPTFQRPKLHHQQQLIEGGVGSLKRSNSPKLKNPLVVAPTVKVDLTTAKGKSTQPRRKPAPPRPFAPPKTENSRAVPHRMSAPTITSSTNIGSSTTTNVTTDENTYAVPHRNVPTVTNGNISSSSSTTTNVTTVENTYAVPHRNVPATNNSTTPSISPSDNTYAVPHHILPTISGITNTTANITDTYIIEPYATCGGVPDTLQSPPSQDSDTYSYVQMNRSKIPPIGGIPLKQSDEDSYVISDLDANTYTPLSFSEKDRTADNVYADIRRDQTTDDSIYSKPAADNVYADIQRDQETDDSIYSIPSAGKLLAVHGNSGNEQGGGYVSLALGRSMNNDSVYQDLDLSTRNT